MTAALIVGLAGETLSPDERAFLREAQPAGLILFARNCRDPDQLRRLVADARAAIGAGDGLVLIDQEGGRVRRLKPPAWRDLPAAAVLGRLYARDPAAATAAAFAVARLTAHDLRALGINVNCVPVLDIPAPGAHEVIGERAYGVTPHAVIALGRAVAEGCLAGGVVPVMKHVPGHGRAMADSHLELPRIDALREALSATDFVPFAALCDLPAAMTAHVVYAALDPTAPATQSPTVINETIRGAIGFDGLLLSDDLGMKALSGSMRERAAAAIAAGCDIALHCSGDLAEARDARAGVPPLTSDAARRLARCHELTRTIAPFDVAAAEATCAGLTPPAMRA